MSDLNTELVLRAVNYHGKELNSLIRETHQLLFMNVDYHLFQQRPRDVLENEENLRTLNRFIAQNLPSLFRNVPRRESEMARNEDLRHKCPVMPPYEAFYRIDPGDRLLHLFQVVSVGDVIIARVETLMSDGDTQLSMQCFDPATQKSRYVEDLDVKCACSMYEMIPLGANKGDMIRMVIKEVLQYKQTLVVSVKKQFLPASKMQIVKLGLVRGADLPSVYRNTGKAVGRGMKYGTVLENNARFHDHDSIGALCQDLGIVSGPTSLVMGVGRKDRKMCIDHLARGIECYKQGKNKEAFDHLNTALIIEPSNVEALIARGVLLSNDGNLDVALVDFEKALQINPDHPKAQKYMKETLLLLAKDLKDSNKVSSLIASYDLILATHPNHEALLEAKWQLMRSLRIDESVLRGDVIDRSPGIDESVVRGNVGSVTVNKSIDHLDGGSTIPLMLPHMNDRKRELVGAKNNKTSCPVMFGKPLPSSASGNTDVRKTGKNLQNNSPVSRFEMSFSLSESDDNGPSRTKSKKSRKFEEGQNSKCKEKVSFSLSDSDDNGPTSHRSKRSREEGRNSKCKEKISFSLSESDDNGPTSVRSEKSHKIEEGGNSKRKEKISFSLSESDDNEPSRTISSKSQKLIKKVNTKSRWDVKVADKEISSRNDKRNSKSKTEVSLRNDLKEVMNEAKRKCGTASNNEVRVIKLEEQNNNECGASTGFRRIAAIAVKKLESRLKQEAPEVEAPGDMERAANNVNKLNKKIEERHLLSGSWERTNQETDSSRNSKAKLVEKLISSKHARYTTETRNDNVGEGSKIESQERSNVSNGKAEVENSAVDIKRSTWLKFKLNTKTRNKTNQVAVDKSKKGLKLSDKVKLSEIESRPESLGLQTKPNSSRNKTSSKMPPIKQDSGSQIGKPPELFNLSIPVPSKDKNLPIPVPAKDKNLPIPVPAKATNLPIPVPAMAKNLPIPVPAIAKNLPAPVPVMAENLPIPVPAVAKKAKNSFRGRKR